MKIRFDALRKGMVLADGSAVVSNPYRPYLCLGMFAGKPQVEVSRDGRLTALSMRAGKKIRTQN